ncbi:hypothetical protein OG978_10930 [Streptomyces sp. NBC_01591]|uniref:hypothetical protein n=1 Tax=Streptomyces sp. NBC_01591 TaxID=2975888 RepID=UPI002DD826F9|nr:hypothetical protein [Streptomyces sp. NBC_01591]WSD67859.1 hypothetical protein OG978_10930 [Streptomyces sp. NBC_01591]
MPDDVPDEEYFVHGDEQQSWAIRTKYLSDMLKISHPVTFSVAPKWGAWPPGPVWLCAPCRSR